MVEAEIWTVAKTDQGNAVLVKPKDGDRAVPIFIGPLEAQNILLGLGEVEIPRPLTHDLMLKILEDLAVRVVRVEIHTLSEGTYYSNLILDQAGRKLEVDARPSDALALAVRIACPIFISADLIDETGIPLDQLQKATDQEESGEKPDESHADSDPIPKDKQLALLQERLDQLVAQEQYEEAAEIRDLIKDFEENGD